MSGIFSVDTTRSQCYWNRHKMHRQSRYEFA